MGSYSVLRIGNIDLQLRAEKNDFNPTVLVLFDESDKRIRELLVEDYHNLEEWDEGELPETMVDYAISLVVVKDRLEFMSFTLEKVSFLFQQGREQRIADLLVKRQADPERTHVNQYHQYLDQEFKVWEELTYEIWLSGLEYIFANRLDINKQADCWLRESSFSTQLQRTVRSMLLNKYDGLFGFPSYDHRSFIRAAIEVVGTDADLVYDLTDLIAVGYLEAHEDLCAEACWRISEDPTIQKIVILTEGKSDQRVLESSLRLLYPHLAQYYSFMDFDSARVAGSASELVKTVKAFIGAGINNRIVALFDNDTAAYSAIRALNGVKIPDNVRVLHYPNIQVAQNYPTLGPQGTVKMDVNGLAGSLELYFGLDVLTRDDDTLTPIQWRGYDQALGQYQGELLDKAELQKKFERKLQSCQRDRGFINQSDWSGIQAILDLLRTAFHD
jgi:hypothetical protein